MPVPKARQLQAMAYLNEQIFQKPGWLFNKAILMKVDLLAIKISALGAGILERLLKQVMYLQRNIRFFGEANSYTGEALLSDVRKCIWSELTDRQNDRCVSS